MEMASYIEECEINFLSLERAAAIVPPEFIAVWNWFQQHEGSFLPVLPMGRATPSDLPLKITRQAGIHSPNYSELASQGANKEKYVLSIHSGSSRYDDKELIQVGDGTWILDYRSQKAEEGRKGSTHFNDEMMNNLRDGVPVGVMVKRPEGGYQVCGLGFIEQYNAATDSFLIHGPVTLETEAEGFFSTIEIGEYSPEEIDILREWDAKDERLKTTVEQIQRQGQSKFRQELRRAYDDTCVITSVDIPDVLQAAHIASYRGPKTQIVNNGLLLRSDMHLLFDAHLLAIHPENHKVILSDRLRGSGYKKYEGVQIASPHDKNCSPKDELLDIHYQQFLIENR